MMAGSAALAAVGLATAGLAQGVTPDRLLAAGTEAEASNWLMVHKTYDSNRFSPLNQINAANVAGMKLAFAVPLGGLEPSAFGIGYMEGTPLVDNGFMYVSDPWGTPYKIDVSSGERGKVLWVCDTGIDKDPSRGILLAHRGLALSGTNVITALNDGRVVACDSETGEIVWEQQVATEPGEGFTAPALVVGDKILIGQSYGDWATRGWLAALSAEDGSELWRFYTVPEPGQPGSETWLCEEAGNPDCWKTGGAALWVTGSYDPETNLTYWGTGNPVPMFDPEYRPGDNLYSNSSIAVDVDSG
jgi:alcohol dehydrogenase (cytochrome c)